jgi:hypothetical protein
MCSTSTAMAFRSAKAVACKENGAGRASRAVPF